MHHHLRVPTLAKLPKESGRWIALPEEKATYWTIILNSKSYKSWTTMVVTSKSNTLPPKKTPKSLWQSWTHFRISIRFPNVSILRQVLVQLMSFFDQKGTNITNIWTQGFLSHLFHPIWAIDHIPRSELPDRFWQNFHYDTPPFGFSFC